MTNMHPSKETIRDLLRREVKNAKSRPCIKIIAVVAVVLLIATILYPPWNYTFHAVNKPVAIQPAGYHLIFTPPMPHITVTRPHPHGVHIDFTRVMLAWVAIGLIAGGVIWLRR